MKGCFDHCVGGLTYIKEATAIAFPKTECKRHIVHQVRKTLKYAPSKGGKAFAIDRKTICQVAAEKKAMVRVTGFEPAAS